MPAWLPSFGSKSGGVCKKEKAACPRFKKMQGHAARGNAVGKSFLRREGKGARANVNASMTPSWRKKFPEGGFLLPQQGSKIH